MELSELPVSVLVVDLPGLDGGRRKQRRVGSQVDNLQDTRAYGKNIR